MSRAWRKRNRPGLEPSCSRRHSPRLAGKFSLPFCACRQDDGQITYL